VRRRHDVPHLEAGGGGKGRHVHGPALRQRLRGLELAADAPVLAARDGDGNEPCVLLEHHRPRLVQRPERARAREHERGADVGVAGEGHLGRRREDAHAAVVPLLRRQHERRLGVVELAGDQLHLGGAEPLRLGQHGERVPAEARVGEDVAGVVAVAHMEPSL